MHRRRGFFTAAIAIAAFSLWLLLAGPDRVLGVDAGNAGVALLMSVAWGSLHAISRLPAGGADDCASPGEWRAWIALGFTMAIAAYAITHATVFQGPRLAQNPDALRIGRNIALLAIAWAILSKLLASRRLDKVQEDERDRAVAARAGSWARTTLVVYAIGLALLLAFSPAERLAWAPPPMVAHLLVVGLILSCAVEYGVIALAYWRDRH